MELYDPNTELILEGRVLSNTGRTPAYTNKTELLPLVIHHRLLFVITGPSWYSKRLGLYLKKGQRVRVVGSKVYGPDGRIYIIARKIMVRKKGKVKYYIFRDERYVPLWWKGKESKKRLYPLPLIKKVNN